MDGNCKINCVLYTHIVTPIRGPIYENLFGVLGETPLNSFQWSTVTWHTIFQRALQKFWKKAGKALRKGTLIYSNLIINHVVVVEESGENVVFFQPEKEDLQ